MSHNDTPNPNLLAIARLKSHLDGMRATQTRLQDTRTALASGLFDPPADAPAGSQDALNSLAQRLRTDAQHRTAGMDDLIDTVQHLQQDRVLQDLHATMHRMDAMRRFSAAHAKAHSPHAQAPQPSSPTGPQQDAVIDVQAKEVPPAASS
jgi:hypothetical protein